MDKRKRRAKELIREVHERETCFRFQSRVARARQNINVIDIWTKL